MNAEEIIARTVEVYATCDSYQDEGKSVSTCGIGRRPVDRHTSVRPFASAFVRPDSFRFEYWTKGLGPLEEGIHYVVWSEDGAFRNWWTLEPKKVKRYDSISSATAGPTGVSGGTAHRIPSLLVSFSSLDPDYSLLRSELLGETPCFVLRRSTGEDSETLWIDESTGLILRVDERERITRSWLPFSLALRHPWTWFSITFSMGLGRHKSFISETTTTYRPQLNCTIPAERFAFDPSADPGIQET